MTTVATSGTQRSRGARISRAAVLVTAGLLLLYAWSDHAYLGGEPGFGRAQQALAGLALLLASLALAPHAWRCRALLSLAAFAVTLFAADVLLSVCFAPRFRPPFVYDPTFLFKLRPGLRGEFVHHAANGGGRVKYRVNSDGYRGKDLAPTGALPRVVVYGDSFIQAIGSADDATFCARLEQALTSRCAKTIEVVNAGVAGYGPDQIAIRMVEELPRLRPDLVIVSVFAGNDFGDLERNKLFRLSPEGVLQPNPWSLSPEVKARFKQNEHEAIVKLALRSLLRGRELPSLPEWVAGATDPALAIVDFWRQRASEEHKDFAVDRSDVVSNLNVDHYNADCSVDPQSDSARLRTRMMDAVLQRVRDAAAGAGVPLVLMLVPHPMDACPDYAASRIDHGRYPEYRRDRLTNTLAQMCERHRIRNLDLFTVFRDRPAATIYFLGGDDHWNDAGQDLAASAMTDFLARHELLPGKGR